MQYTECLPENRPLPITRDVVREFRFDYRVRYDETPILGGLYVDVVVARKKGNVFKRGSIMCCATIDLSSLRMKIYGDVHKSTMLDLARELEKRLAKVPKRYIMPGQLRVDFVSHNLWAD